MASKRKHVTLSINEKIELIKTLEAGYTVTALSKKYKVGKSTICDIKKNKNRILSYATTSSSLIHKRRTLKVSAYPQVDKAVYTWFLQERSRGKKIIDYYYY
jgi:IS30 family transposase